MSGWGLNTPREVALSLAADLEAELDALPEIEGDAFDERQASRNRYNSAIYEMKQRLSRREEGRPTTIREGWDGACFAALGFRATSTSGLAGAIHNWIAQVRNKAGRA